MKISVVLCILAVLLTGCGTAVEYETVMDVQPQLLHPEKCQVELELPEDAVLAVLENKSNDKIYFCDGFEITVQTVESGDLRRIIRDATGYPMEKLTIMETASGPMKRYDCVWSAVGEEEDRVGRAAILDDGGYCYILTAMADAGKTEAVKECWDELFRSFMAVSTAA